MPPRSSIRSNASTGSPLSTSTGSSPGSRPRRALSSPPSRTAVPIPVYIERFLIDNSYTFLKPLTQNQYAIFVAARHNASGETCGVTKVVNIGKNIFLAKRALRQIRILKHARAHRNVLCMYDLDVVLDAHSEFQDIYIYTELMQNSMHMLLSTLHTPHGPHTQSHTRTLTLQHTQYLLYQLLCALKYLHSAGVVHGNVHPHSILVNADSTLKLAFFADAKPGIDKEIVKGTKTNNNIESWVKSPLEFQTEGRRALEVRMGDQSMVWYNSPEILLNCPQKLTTTTDIWSVGCLMGEMLGGAALFPGDDASKVVQLIHERLGTPNQEILPRFAPTSAFPLLTSNPPKRPLPFEGDLFDTGAVSPLALDLLCKLLQWDPTARLNAAEAVEHPWFSGWRDTRDEGVCERPYDFSSEATQDLESIKDLIVDEIEDFRVGVRVEVQQLMSSSTPLDILSRTGGGLVIPQGNAGNGVRNSLDAIALRNDLTRTGEDGQSDADADGESDWEMSGPVRSVARPILFSN